MTDCVLESQPKLVGATVLRREGGASMRAHVINPLPFYSNTLAHNGTNTHERM